MGTRGDASHLRLCPAHLVSEIGVLHKIVSLNETVYVIVPVCRLLLENVSDRHDRFVLPQSIGVVSFQTLGYTCLSRI